MHIRENSFARDSHQLGEITSESNLNEKRLRADDALSLFLFIIRFVWDAYVEPALLEKIASLLYRIEKLEADKRIIEASGRESLSPADPDAKIMKTKEGFMPAYNVQSVVDSKHHMIGMMDVTDEPIDYHCLGGNVKALKEQLEIIPEEILADKGYANED